MLIAAFFCLCNRYVDGLATWAPDDPEFYRRVPPSSPSTAIARRHRLRASSQARLTPCRDGAALVAARAPELIMIRRSRCPARVPARHLPQHRIRPAPSRAVSPTTPLPPCRAPWSSPRNLDTGIARSRVGGDDGFFRLLLLPVGRLPRDASRRRSLHGGAGADAGQRQRDGPGSTCSSSWRRSPRRSP